MLRVLVPSDGSPISQYGVRHAVREFMKTTDLDDMPVEVIAGVKASSLERVGVSAGIGTGLLVLSMATD